MAFPFMPPPPIDRSSLRQAYRKPNAPPPYWAGGPQPISANHSARNLALATAGAAGLVGAGFIPISRGRRVWDSYRSLLRHVEELSPSRIFRTFQYHEMLTPLGTYKSFRLPFESFSRQFRSHSGQLLTTPRNAAQRFVARMTGRSVAELEATGAFSAMGPGLRFERTGSIWGRVIAPSGTVLSEAALPMDIGHSAGNQFIDWFARVSGVNLGAGESVFAHSATKTAFVTAPKLDKVLGIPLTDVAALRLQKVRVMGRLMRSYWAGQIGRLNRLLEAPFELLPIEKIPVLGKGLKWLGGHLAVKPGTASSMLLRYAGKGVAIAAGYEALRYLSFLRSRSDSRVKSALAGTALGAGVGFLVRHTPMGALVGAGIGGILGGAPLFDKGIIEGFATAVKRAHIGYAKYVSQPLGLTQAAKEQEAIMPGVTHLRSIVGLGISGAIGGSLIGGLARWKYQAKHGYEAFDEASRVLRQAIKEEKAAGGILGKIRTALWPKAIGKDVELGLAARAGKIGLYTGLGIAGAFIAGAALATGHLPGLFGTEHTPKELEDIYSGKQEVPVRKGHWWIFGRSPWQGGRIEYYRPNWYTLLMSKSRTKQLWGSEEEEWRSKPLLHPIQALTSDEFKYRWEREHYKEYPFPESGTYFENVPFIGPLLSGLGRLIKPPRLMHTEEWLPSGRVQGTGTEGMGSGQGPGGGPRLQIPVRHFETAAMHEAPPELGGLPRGTPVSPLSFKQELGRQIYNINELRGLTGFVHGAIKQHLTGNQNYFNQQEQIQTSTTAIGPERWYWEKELGGLGGQTELYRRFLPHRRREIEQYNPLRNQMPSWLPSGDYYIDFLHGSPYSKIHMGESRLPGRGYAALHPELTGVAPEDYPLFYRYKILADVAMYSKQFKATRLAIRSAIRRGELSQEQVRQVQEINRQVSEKKKRKAFQEYQFSDDALQKMRVTVKEEIAPGTFSTENAGIFKLSGVKMAHDAIAKGNEDILNQPNRRKKRLAIADYLREYIRPGAELDVYVHGDRALRYQEHGPKGQPFQPAMVVANGVNLGAGLVEQGLATYEKGGPIAAATRPASQRAIGRLWENITHYENPFEYLQPMAPIAKFLHARSPIEEYERTRIFAPSISFWQTPMKSFIKPAYWMTRNELGTQQMPENVKERYRIEEYFDKLRYLKYHMLEQEAKQIGDRESVAEFKEVQQRTLTGVNPYGSFARIFSALPALERDYFEPFSKASKEEDQKRIAHLVPKAELPIYEAQWKKRLAASIRARRDMGVEDASDKDTLKELYLERRAEGRPITSELVQQYRKEAHKGESYADWSRRKELEDYFTTHPLPGPDWVGWRPEADLRDVELKMINNTALDMHDFNLWGTRQRALARKPYLNEEAMSQVTEMHGTPGERIREIESILRESLGLQNIQVTATPSPDGEDHVHMNMQDDRRGAFYRYKSDPNFFAMV